MKFHLWMKCLATSVAALPYTAVPMSCQGMRGVFMRSTPSKGWKQHSWVRISRGGVQDGRKKNEKWNTEDIKTKPVLFSESVEMCTNKTNSFNHLTKISKRMNVKHLA